MRPKLLLWTCFALCLSACKTQTKPEFHCVADDDGDICTWDQCDETGTRHVPLLGTEDWYQCITDVTFFAMGDPQFGGGADDKNDFQINAMNNFPGALWPGAFPSGGELVKNPIGVIIAGDLTQNGKDGREEFSGPGEDELGRFLADYGLLGTEGKLHYPVYEGYGNHDYDPDEPDDDFSWKYFYEENPTPAVDVVAARNAHRYDLTSMAKSKQGHYSWDWGNVHLVNVNLFAGDEASQEDDNAKVRDPRQSLTFLKDDLATNVGASWRPVVISMHYGFDEFGYEERWWTDAQKEAFLTTIRPYNIIAIIHGHTHATSHYEWNGYDIYNVGSPYYLNYNWDGRGHFTLFRITDSHMEVADVAWSPSAEGMNVEFGNWSHIKPLKIACTRDDLELCVQ